jgi:hypothetical protein
MEACTLLRFGRGLSFAWYPVLRVTGGVKRGLAWVLVAMLAMVTSAGCASNPKLDPTVEPVTAQRKASIDGMLAAARAVGAQFGAATPLGVRTDTACSAGTDNWESHDPYRSKCFAWVTTAYAVDIPPLPALSGLDARLKTTGWTPSPGGWSLTGGRGEVVDLEAWNRLGFSLDDLVGVGYVGPYGEMLKVRPQRSVMTVLTPEPQMSAIPGGVYFGRTEGTNWQETWAGERAHHPYVLLVSASSDFAQQPW